MKCDHCGYYGPDIAELLVAQQERDRLRSDLAAIRAVLARVLPLARHGEDCVAFLPCCCALAEARALMENR